MDNYYHIAGRRWSNLFGSREQVYNGTAYKTAGNLTKKDLFFNKNGRIVSAKKHKTASIERRLEKHGYFARKGRFGYVRKTQKKSKEDF